MSHSIKGPSSALSSFLREKGIRVPPTNRRIVRENATQDTDLPGGSNDGGSTTNSNDIININQNDNNEENNDIDIPDNSDEMDITAGVESRTCVSNIRSSVGSKKKKKEESDDDNISDPFSTSKVAPRYNYSKKRHPDDDPLGEYVRLCMHCQRRFLVSEGGTALCQACVNLPAQKGASKVRKLKKQLISDIEENQVSALKTLCVRFIAQHIENVDQFGDIPSSMKVKISKIISRYRQLNKVTMKLFLGPDEEIVELFDCSKIDAEGFQFIAETSPNIKRLNLSFCGRINDAVLNKFAVTFTHLRELKLGGCYLVTEEAFQTLFAHLAPTLVVLVLQEAAKLKSGAFEELATHGRLRELTLKRSHSIDDTCLLIMKAFKKLTKLKLIEMNNAVLSNETLASLLQEIGPSITELTLSGFEHLSDTVLHTLALHSPLLCKLSLKNSTSLTNEGLVTFFTTSPCQFTKLNFTGLHRLCDKVLHTALVQSKKVIEILNLHGCDELTSQGFQVLIGDVSVACVTTTPLPSTIESTDSTTFPSTKSTTTFSYNSSSYESVLNPMLRELNLSWIRSVDDELLKRIADASPLLKKVSLYGCNELTRIAFGIEWKNASHEPIRLVGNEFI